MPQASVFFIAMGDMISGGVRMEIRVLRYFLTVVREESITKAADVLHITQPTLSRQIAQMEEELGIKLFDRSARRITLTNEGILLRRRAEEILELVDKTEKELFEQDEMIGGTISIGCGDLAAVQLLPDLFRSFHERYPVVSFDLYTATADHVKERMDRGLSDIGLLMEPVDMEKYDYIRMNQREQWVVAMHPDTPLAALECISPKDLTDVPLILPRRMNVRSELAHWFGEDFDRLTVLFTANLPSNACVMVYHKLAYFITIQGSISFWDKEKVTYRPLSPALTTTSVLAWKRQQPFSVAASAFINYAKEVLQ